MCTFLSIHLDVLAQPTDNCNSSFSGQGIPVSDQCDLRGFNVMNNYVSNINSNSAYCNANSSAKDAFWWFQGTGGTVVIRYKPTGGSVTAGLYNPTMTVYTGTCSNTSGGTYATCVNEAGNGIMEVITMATNANQKYRIRVQNIANNSGSGQGGTIMYGQICVMSVTAPTENNRPCNPNALIVDSIAKPNYFQLSDFTTNIISPTPTCATPAATKKKAYFTVTMPSSDLVIETEKKGIGTSTNSDPGYINAAMAIYKVSGSGCTTGAETYTQINCTTGGANYGMTKHQVPNGSGTGQATTGQKLLIIVWSENNNSTSYFGISAYTSTQCGNPLGLKNDFCENPAQMFKAPGTVFSASTAGVFTPDQFSSGQTPNWNCTNGQSSIYVHNNSWYQFTADSTTEVFPFSAGCEGIQAVVLEPTYNSLGCCTGSFTKKSNCNSQMANGTNAGTITATNLVVGRKYVLMVDGYAGAQCNFSIMNWNAQNILLGINLADFSAEAHDTYNTLRWTTKSEVNNDYFTVLKSIDGYTWEEIEKIEGAGTSNQEISYETYDQNLRLGTIYYKLKQTDFDGEFTYSNIIVLNRGSKETGIITVAPNPTAGEVTINILNNENEGFITVTTLNGQVVYQTTINNKGIHAVTFDMEDMPQGVYLVNYKDASTQSIRQLVRQ